MLDHERLLFHCDEWRITAYRVNSFWTTSVWRISVKYLGLISHCFECTINSLFYKCHAARICHHVEQLLVLCYSVCCHGNLVFSNLLPGNDSFVAIRRSGNVVTEPLLGNGRPLPLDCSGFQQSCHNMYSYRETEQTKQRSWHWTNIWPWVPGGPGARIERAGWLPAVSFCFCFWMHECIGSSSRWHTS
jgi:hypothetical protein